MPVKPPQLLVQAFVVCREIFEAPNSKDLLLVAPFSAIKLPHYPARCKFSVYAHLTEARGRYAMSLHLEDPEGQVVWKWDLPGPVEQFDPLQSHRVALHDIVIEIPRPRRYNLIMLANGDELAHHVLLAREPGATA